MHYPTNAHHSIFKISLICQFIPPIWPQVNKYKVKQDCNLKVLPKSSLSILPKMSQYNLNFLAKCKLSQCIQVLLVSMQLRCKGHRVKFNPVSNHLLPSMYQSNQKCNHHLNTRHKFTLCMQVCNLLKSDMFPYNQDRLRHKVQVILKSPLKNCNLTARKYSRERRFIHK